MAAARCLLLLGAGSDEPLVDIDDGRVQENAASEHHHSEPRHRPIDGTGCFPRAAAQTPAVPVAVQTPRQIPYTAPTYPSPSIDDAATGHGGSSAPPSRVAGEPSFSVGSALPVVPRGHRIVRACERVQRPARQRGKVNQGRPMPVADRKPGGSRTGRCVSNRGGDRYRAGSKQPPDGRLALKGATYQQDDRVASEGIGEMCVGLELSLNGVIIARRVVVEEDLHRSAVLLPGAVAVGPHQVPAPLGATGGRPPLHQPALGTPACLAHEGGEEAVGANDTAEGATPAQHQGPVLAPQPLGLHASLSRHHLGSQAIEHVVVGAEPLETKGAKRWSSRS